MMYGYNYRWNDGVKQNSVSLDDVDALFVNSKVAFTKQYLRYHGMLQFRGFLSGKAITFAGHHVLFEDNHVQRTVEYLYQRARFLFLAMSGLTLFPNGAVRWYIPSISSTVFRTTP